MIWHSKPTFSAAEEKAVARVLKSGYVSEGPTVRELEQAVADALGVRGAVALSSGTAALHMALLAVGVGPRDQVILPSYVCTSVLDAIGYVGARPTVVDIDPATLSIDFDAARKALTKRAKAIVVPHLFGIPAVIERFRRLGVPVIEDAAQAIGADYRGRPLGTWGDVGVLSFYATKLLTTGYGGMLVSRKQAHVSLARDLKAFDERGSYQLRWHYAMSEIQAAVGLVQWKCLAAFLRKRKAIAQKYLRAVPRDWVVSPERSNFFRFLLRVPGPAGRWIKMLHRRGIEAKRPIFRPLHRYLGLDKDKFPVTESAQRHVVSVPIYPAMTARECAIVTAALRELCAP